MKRETVTPETHVLEVWGDFACFTRPELKVERFSYPVITPSAARGIFDAIYCKPVEFRWQITKVEILKPVQYIALRRNEMKGKLAEAPVLKWARGADAQPMWADGDEEGSGRTQRQTMALKDVRYRLHAHMVLWQESIPAGKVNSEFRRRANAGKCFAQPSFGLREFPAYFELATENNGPAISWDADLGWMLYDVFDLSRLGASHDAASVSIFRAHVKGGSMDVPPFSSPDVRKVEGGSQ
jgi:CRISPR-associated protein Cas5d